MSDQDDSASPAAVVQSRTNPFFKRLRLLAGATQKQSREGVAILEGIHLADALLQVWEQRERGNAGSSEAVANVPMPEVERIVVSKSALARADVAAVVARLRRHWANRLTVFDDALFQQVSPVSDGGLGMLMLVAAPREGLKANERIAQTCVILDGVQDAGNVGSILRSAAAAGVTLAICLPGTASVWSTKVLRAAMGAHFVMRIVEQAIADDVAPALDVPVVITDSHADATIYDADLRGGLAWVMGNEGAGVSVFWRERAARRLTIPQPGRIESLNVAAAAAICLFEQTRQSRR